MSVLCTSSPPQADLEQEGWPVWLAAILPGYCTHPFAEHHVAFWDRVWRIEPGVRPPADVDVWARGGAKSTSAEAACVTLGARGKRRYALYVCDTQDRADDHVSNIGSMLESERLELFYPELGERLVGKFGNPRGWRRNRLRCSNGFTVDAIGLDVASRGVKLEDQRPDLIIIDDIDGQHDTKKTTAKKVATLTGDLIPAGSEDVAVIAIQNLIHPNGVFAQLVDGRADFLQRRVVSGPIPAVEGLVVQRIDGKDVITAGTATWPGQSIERCQEMIADMGLRAFNRECQHAVHRVEGALWLQEQIDASRVDDFPEISMLAVAVDPSGGDGESNDEQGIVAVGKGYDGHAYVLEDATVKLSPGGWGRTAVDVAIELQADVIVVEKNYGGEMARHTIRTAADFMVAEGVDEARPFSSQCPNGVEVVDASRGKRVRAEPVAALYGERERPETWQDARVHHVGRKQELEQEQTSWNPEKSTDSPNRVDALVWAVTFLLFTAGQRKVVDTWAA